VNFVSTLISLIEKVVINVKCPEVETLMLSLNRNHTKNKTKNMCKIHYNLTHLEIQKKMPYLLASVKMIGNVLNARISIGPKDKNAIDVRKENHICNLFLWAQQEVQHYFLKK